MPKPDESQRPFRLFGGGLATETNAFSPIPAGTQSFVVVRPNAPSAHLARLVLGATFERYREVSSAAGCKYVQGLFAYAPPSGLTSRVAYEELRDELLRDVASAMPLDGVLLTLHGAMAAEGYVECESDIVQRVRRIVGDAKIGVFLDPHCDLPDELIDTADVIVACKEYPHVDIKERAGELTRLVIAAGRGAIEPVLATFDCRMIGLYPTQDGPMRGFVDQLIKEEAEPGVLSISLGHGFPWSDAPAAGTRILVIVDGDRARAEALAGNLGRELFSLRHVVNLVATPMAPSLDRALSLAQSQHPIVIADISDNPGGGAASDSTFVLAELLDRGANNVALALLWDPVAVEQAFAAGEGAHLSVRLGGKMGPMSGAPLDLEVTVERLTEDLVQRVPLSDGFVDAPCGRCARISHNGVDIVVSSVRHQARSLEVFTSVGINPHERSILVVKSTNHFHAAFAPIAAEIIYLDAPGTLHLDPTKLPYRHTDRRKFPWVDDPWD